MNDQNNIKVAITGAGGLIGSRLSVYLKSNTQLNIVPFFRHPIVGDELSLDLSDAASFPSKLAGVDVVIHCAGMPDKACEASKEQCFEVNSRGTLALYEAAVRSNVGLFIFLSTIHVYGSPLAGDLVEDRALSPKTNYAQSKALAESLLEKAQSKTKVVILRLSNFVGCPIVYEACNWNLLIPNLCYQAVKYNRIHLNSDGEGIRNFAPISSLEKIMTELIERQVNLDQFNLFNLGSPQNYTIREIGQMVRRIYQNITDNKIEISFGDYHDPSIVKFVFDTNKIRSKLNTNEFRLEEEIKHIFDLLLRLNSNGKLT